MSSLESLVDLLSLLSNPQEILGPVGHPSRGYGQRRCGEEGDARPGGRQAQGHEGNRRGSEETRRRHDGHDERLSRFYGPTKTGQRTWILLRAKKAPTGRCRRGLVDVALVFSGEQNPANKRYAPPACSLRCRAARMALGLPYS